MESINHRQRVLLSEDTKAGAWHAAVLQKPFAPSAFLNVVAQLLRSDTST